MLSAQKNKPEFTGGLEASRLKEWHCEELYKLKPKQMFFAYDTPDDLEPLFCAGKILKKAGLKYNQLRCYVLIGYPKDTFESAEKRLIEANSAGFLPMAMLYRDKVGNYDKEWRNFQRTWCRPAVTKFKLKQLDNCIAR